MADGILSGSGACKFRYMDGMFSFFVLFLFFKLDLHLQTTAIDSFFMFAVNKRLSSLMSLF